MAEVQPLCSAVWRFEDTWLENGCEDGGVKVKGCAWMERHFEAWLVSIVMSGCMVRLVQ